MAVTKDKMFGISIFIGMLGTTLVGFPVTKGAGNPIRGLYGDCDSSNGYEFLIVLHSQRGSDQILLPNLPLGTVILRFVSSYKSLISL
jgi:hypothetical protein